MAYQVLYRTYRPSCFSEVVGQTAIVKTLKNAIKTKRIAHAYLFCGPRGTGKTTVAKLFAKAINCLEWNEESCDNCDSCQAFNNNTHPDIYELDAASNNGVDDIREIVDQVLYPPVMGKYKVYIIDEVHMLSTNAFNALLKTLEEPPAHVVFILATTDPQKIIPTVLSRCQRYNFAKISSFDIKKRMIEVLNSEHIKYEEQALNELASLAEGGLRDALSSLEQVLAYNPEGIFLNDVESIFGLSSTEDKLKLLTFAHKKQMNETIALLRGMYQRGFDIRRLITDLLDIIKEALLYAENGSDELLQKINRIQAQELLSCAGRKDLINDLNYFEDVLSKNRASQNVLTYLELCFVKIAGSDNNVSQEIKLEEIKIAEPAAVEEQPQDNIQLEESSKAVEEEEIIENRGNQRDYKFLHQILLRARRDNKINDEVIFNKLELYRYEADKRRFYELLNHCDFFASSHDAIVVSCNTMQANNINDVANNEDLYNFINTEFGINKMIYAIDEEEKKILVDMYHKDRNLDPDFKVEKYQTIKEPTMEDKLNDLFGKVRVEE